MKKSYDYYSKIIKLPIKGNYNYIISDNINISSNYYINKNKNKCENKNRKNTRLSQEKSRGKFNENTKEKIIITHKTYNSRSISPNIKNKKYQNDPFSSSSKYKTNFCYVYNAGGIPCRLDFGVKMKLKWTILPKDLNYEPILEICFEGLLEVDHPYKFIARNCIREMINAENSYEKILPILNKLLIKLRKALECDIEDVFIEAMNILIILSKKFKEELNPFLFLVLQPINKRSFKIKYREKVFNLLRELENNGGEDAYLIIKNKIPSYSSNI